MSDLPASYDDYKLRAPEDDIPPRRPRYDDDDYEDDDRDDEQEEENDMEAHMTRPGATVTVSLTPDEARDVAAACEFMRILASNPPDAAVRLGFVRSLLIRAMVQATTAPDAAEIRDDDGARFAGGGE